MKSYYIQYLSEDEKELISKRVSWDEIKDYDVLIMYSEDYYDTKRRIEREKIRGILNES